MDIIRIISANNLLDLSYEETLSFDRVVMFESKAILQAAVRI